ncbi:MAG: ABC transporter permease [Eubacteriales bacterium]|nr:ABC transporter permease [Eubacteriales bacterium]
MPELFSLALKSIWSNKLRSFLTMLGIIIGVASVIILVSLVNGYMSYMTDSFNNMGTNQISVSLTNTSTRYVNEEQMYALYKEHGDVFSQMSPVVSISGRVKTSYESLSRTSVKGVDEEYAAMQKWKMCAGRFISYPDVANRQKTAVIGYYDACELFGSAEGALGETLKINGSAFQVIGVVERQEEDDLSEGGADDMVLIPSSTALRMNRSDLPSGYIFAVADINDSEKGVEILEEYLESVFMSDSLYTVTSMSEMLSSLNSMINMLSLVLGGIAGISLLVAGVGVMNIMLVSVTERTREIGIRKALGERRSSIMTQFVIEAALTSVIGGVIGIGLGSAFCSVIGQMIGVEAPPTAGAIMVSFGVSVAIGLVFGYLPAARAAKLNPIEALRSE